MRYEFLTTEGKTCCAGDDPALLCASCKAALDYGSVPDAYREGIAKLRAAQGITVDTITDDDPRLRAMAAFRERLYAQAMMAALQSEPATSEVHLNPPDSYQLALDRMRKEQQR